MDYNGSVTAKSNQKWPRMMQISVIWRRLSGCPKDLMAAVCVCSFMLLSEIVAGLRPEGFDQTRIIRFSYGIDPARDWPFL